MAPKSARSKASGSRRAAKRDRSADEPEESRPQRRLDRRDTDDRVERIVARKLYPKFARELIEGTVAEDGTTPRSMIADAVRRSKGSSEYLKQEFWTAFFAKFPFHNTVGGMVPEPTSDAECRSEVFEALEKLERGKLYYAVSAVAQGQVHGICHMIRRHAANEPIDDKVLSSADAFFKDCHARLLHFVVVHVSGKRLTGRVALNWSWGRLAQKEKAGEPIEMNDLKMLRQYQAFLTPKQSEQLDKWMSQCINAAINSFKRIDNGEQAASSSASSSAAVVTVEPTNDSVRDTTREAVMQFFATKN